MVSFRIDAAPLPAGLEYFLNSSQWLDAHATGIHRTLPRLVDAVTSALASSSPVARVDRSPDTTAKAILTPPRILVTVVALVGIALAYLFADKFRPSRQRVAGLPTAATQTTAASAKSIAVLPFLDMSEKHDQEYFSDGLSEELIDHLAHITDLKVIARTSSFAFKGKNEDMRSIATKLGVANLLEGSVRESGSTLRITTQLIRAADGVHLWSEIYDRKLTDIFKVQDEISTTVAKELNIALSARPTGATQALSHGTTNVEAYNLVLQANFFYLRGNSGDNAKAIDSLLQALNVDPHYALAWARLARVYGYQGVVGELSAAEAEARGRDAVQRALAMDPKCAEAYYARGNVLRQLVGHWAAAKSDYLNAAALDPHGETGERAQAAIVGLKTLMSGQPGELIDTLHRTLERSPLDTDNMAALARVQQSAALLDESAATSRKLLALNPAYASAQAE